MLPGCPGGQIEKDLILPTGYHSLYVPAMTDVEYPLLGPEMPAYFSDNYFIPNTSQVLVTHLVSYTLQEEAVTLNPMFSKQALKAMPVVVDECKFCGTGMPTDRFCRETGMAACMDCKTSGRYKDKNYTFDSVEDLMKVMENELAELVSQRTPLSEQLEEFEGSLEEFKGRSNIRSNEFKDELVNFMQHYLNVDLSIVERQFDCVRHMSDTERLLECHT